MKNMTCVVVTVLYNQPETFASDIGGDQSRYLLTMLGQGQGWTFPRPRPTKLALGPTTNIREPPQHTILVVVIAQYTHGWRMLDWLMNWDVCISDAVTRFTDSCVTDTMYRQLSPLPLCFAVSNMSALSKLPQLSVLVYRLLPPTAQKVVDSFG